MISVSGLSKSYGAQNLFRDVSFKLDMGERYGLVGANGSGKTTLLNIMSGHETADEGSLSIPKKLRLGVLRQDQFLYDQNLILEVVMMGNRELWEAMVEKEKLLANAADSFDAERYSVLEDVVMRHDGYAAEARAAEILEGLGLPAAVHRQPLSTLSGGFKFRVLLAQVLAGSPDVLLLDEPTNHLDILSIRWLEKYLQGFRGPVLVISHDHRFLDIVCTRILDVDYETVIEYPGNYSDFVAGKQEERDRREKEITKREKEIAHHQKFVDRFRAKASKARQAQSKMRLIEKRAEGLEELPQSSRRYPSFRISQTRPSGRETLTVKGIRKSYGDKEVLHGVDLGVRRGDRLAIMGPNGIGKSTLLKILMGTVEADAGEVEWGYEAQPGYFAQDYRDQLVPETQSAEAWIHEVCPGETIGYVRAQMALVLFSGDEAKKRLGALSGGESARLVFCRLAIEKPNVLVLDEPTNHLDLESIEALVEGLKRYDGTLIFVSHDRWFVSQLATRVVEIRADSILDYAGTYDEYVHYCGDDHLDVEDVVLKAKRQKKAERDDAVADEPAPRKDRDRQQDRNRARKLEARRAEIEREIERAEARVAEIDTIFCEPGYYERTDPEKVRVLQQEREERASEVENLMAEWEAAEKELATLG